MTPIRLAFIAAHSLADERERTAELARRDASLALNIAALLLSDKSRRVITPVLVKTIFPEQRTSEDEQAEMARMLGDDPDDMTPAGFRQYAAANLAILNEYWEGADPLADDQEDDAGRPVGSFSDDLSVAIIDDPVDDAEGRAFDEFWKL